MFIQKFLGWSRRDFGHQGGGFVNIGVVAGVGIRHDRVRSAMRRGTGFIGNRRLRTCFIRIFQAVPEFGGPGGVQTARLHSRRPAPSKWHIWLTRRKDAKKRDRNQVQNTGAQSQQEEEPASVVLEENRRNGRPEKSAQSKSGQGKSGCCSTVIGKVGCR